jgi:branched-chain amino acid aminotransferase
VKVWLNSRLLDAQKASVSVFDHGFLYGDGIYETVRAYDGEVFHWHEHYRRLRESARRITLACPWSARYLEQAIQNVLRANKTPNASVRITISRGPGSLGLDPRLCPRPTLAILLHPERALEKIWREGVSIGIPHIRRNHPLCLDPLIKSNNALNTILAKIEGNRMKVFETVLTNLDGYLTEGTTSNIFFVKKGILYTPALSCGLLNGITRQAVLKISKRARIRLKEGWFTPRELGNADEAFLSSTTLEIAPIISMKQAGKAGTKRIGAGRPGPLTHRMHTLLKVVLPPLRRT